MKPLKEKMEAYHLLQNRRIIWYVLAKLKLSRAIEEEERARNDLSYWLENLTDEDLILARCMISSGITIDELEEFRNKCKKERG